MNTSTMNATTVFYVAQEDCSSLFPKPGWYWGLVSAVHHETCGPYKTRQAAEEAAREG